MNIDALWACTATFGGISRMQVHCVPADGFNLCSFTLRSRMFDEHICWYSFEKNILPCASFIHWVLLVMPGPDVNRIVLFFCMYKSTPILDREWSRLSRAGQMHSLPKQRLFSCLFVLPLSALEIIARPSLSMQREVAASHNTHILWDNLSDKIHFLSAFSLCFALTFPLLRISLFLTLYFPDPGHFPSPTLRT